MTRHVSGTRGGRSAIVAAIIALVFAAGCGSDDPSASNTQPVKAKTAEQPKPKQEQPKKAEPTASEDATTVRKTLRKWKVWDTFGMDYATNLVAVDGEALIVSTNRVEGSDKAEGARFLICDVLNESAPGVLKRRIVQVAGFGSEGGAKSLGICERDAR